MAKVKDPNKLTPAEEKAVKEYIKNGGNQTQAFLKAYPHAKKWKDKSVHQRASRLFSSVKVQSRLDEVEKKALRETEITKEYVLNTIVETIERCKQAQPVLNKNGDPVCIETEDGEMVPAYTFQPLAVLKGAEMLAKHKGLYELDNQQKHPVGAELEKIPLDVQNLILEELNEIIEKDKLELGEKPKPRSGPLTTH